MINYIKKLISNLKYHFDYLGVLNSPFKKLKLKWYFGEIKHGTPYFLPRKWVKCDVDDAINAWEKLSDNSRTIYLRKQSAISWIDNYVKNRTKPVPIKYFGFNTCTLGWKTKWNDYRFEWSPCYSLVIFGKQLFVCVLPKMDEDYEDNFIRQNCYWEVYLTYKYRTDKSKSKEERLREVVKQYSCTWGNEKKGYVDYYPLILNNKYKRIYGSIKE